MPYIRRALPRYIESIYLLLMRSGQEVCSFLVMRAAGKFEDHGNSSALTNLDQIPTT